MLHKNFSTPDFANSASHQLMLRLPAARWQDALPTGNGSVGALVYGNIYKETIVLNHERWWYGSVTPALPEIGGKLPELRQLLRDGQYEQANVFFPNLLRQAGYQARGGMFQPGVDLRIVTDTQGAFSDYSRSVDFKNGQVRVAWSDEEITFERCTFVSRVDDVMVLVLRASEPGKICAAFSLEPRDWRDSLPRGVNKTEIPFTFDSRAMRHDEGALFQIVGTRQDGSTFGAIARVVTHGGKINIADNRVTVEGADEVVVLVKLTTDGHASLDSAQIALSSLGTNYAALLQKHTLEHAEIYDRVQLELDDASPADTVNEQLLLDSYNGNVSPAIVSKMFHFGRYLLISSSRPGGLPANLQGVWNGDYQPAWASAYFNNENIQMNYWQALPGNLAQTLLPLFELYESLRPDFRNNARRFWDCRGLLIPLYLAPDSGQKKDLQSHVVYWTAGAGWIGQLFFEYWRFTGDDAFLAKRAVPWLKETAEFYEDFLVEGADGFYQVMPSNSPENCALGNFAGAGKLPVSINATMDFAVAKESLTNLCAACEHLGIEHENVLRWKRMLSKIPPYQINSDGAIREWMHPDFLDNYKHRHISHIYPVFPATEVTKENAPVIFAACRTAIEKRLVVGLKEQTGWSLAHLANIYARLGEGDRALECLELMARSCVGNNFFAYHNDWRRQGVTLDFDFHGRGAPFQIDANFGWTSAMIEMLVFSVPGQITLLPALPAKWAVGQVSGLRCRGAVQVQLGWNWKRGTLWAQLCSSRDQLLRIQLPQAVRLVEVGGKMLTPIPTGQYEIELVSQLPTRIEASCEHGTKLSVARLTHS